MSENPAKIRDLRRLWKPHKLRLSEILTEHPTNIRFHRAASWIQRAEDVTNESDLEISLISYWVAFNALYGQWNELAHAPECDTDCWRIFLDRMLDLDESNFVVDALDEHKRLVMAIFDDEYLSRFYWIEPTEKQAGKSKKVKYDARTWYIKGNWTLILDRLVERIYLLRCQLVHGASTYNGKLNRTSIRHCATMMDHLLRAFLQVWIHHGADEDWGIMCYPPQRKSSQVGNGRIPQALSSRPMSGSASHDGRSRRPR